MALHKAPRLPRGCPAAKKPRSGGRPAACVKVNKAAQKPRKCPAAYVKVNKAAQKPRTHVKWPYFKCNEERHMASEYRRYHPLDAETEAFWRDHPFAAARKQRLDVDRNSLPNPPRPALPKPTTTATRTKKSTSSHVRYHWDAETKTFMREDPSAAARKQRLDADLDSLADDHIVHAAQAEFDNIGRDNTRKGASGSYGPTRASVQN